MGCLQRHVAHVLHRLRLDSPSHSDGGLADGVIVHLRGYVGGCVPGYYHKSAHLTGCCGVPVLAEDRCHKPGGFGSVMTQVGFVVL